MTHEELEEQFKRMAQVQLETLQLIGRSAERHDREMSELRQALARLAEAQQRTEARLDTLIVTVDRFIQGRGSNGSK
jgi:hypothetical protein